MAKRAEPSHHALLHVLPHLPYLVAMHAVATVWARMRVMIVGR